MKWVVVDASVILAWLLPDENSEFAEEVIGDDGLRLLAPELIHYEVLNAIAVGVRRARLSEQQADEAVALVNLVPVQLERPAAVAILQLSGRFGLSGYDASYLASAARLDAELATFDLRLRTAALQMGVPAFA